MIRRVAELMAPRDERRVIGARILMLKSAKHHRAELTISVVPPPAVTVDRVAARDLRAAAPMVTVLVVTMTAGEPGRLVRDRPRAAAVVPMEIDQPAVGRRGRPIVRDLTTADAPTAIALQLVEVHTPIAQLAIDRTVTVIVSLTEATRGGMPRVLRTLIVPVVTVIARAMATGPGTKVTVRRTAIVRARTLTARRRASLTGGKMAASPMVGVLTTPLVRVATTAGALVIGPVVLARVAHTRIDHVGTLTDRTAIGLAGTAIAATVIALAAATNVRLVVTARPLVIVPVVMVIDQPMVIARVAAMIVRLRVLVIALVAAMIVRLRAQLSVLVVMVTARRTVTASPLVIVPVVKVIDPRSVIVQVATGPRAAIPRSVIVRSIATLQVAQTVLRMGTSVGSEASALLIARHMAADCTPTMTETAGVHGDLATRDRSLRPSVATSAWASGRTRTQTNVLARTRRRRVLTGRPAPPGIGPRRTARLGMTGVQILKNDMAIKNGMVARAGVGPRNPLRILAVIAAVIVLLVLVVDAAMIAALVRRRARGSRNEVHVAAKRTSARPGPTSPNGQPPTPLMPKSDGTCAD